MLETLEIAAAIAGLLSLVILAYVFTKPRVNQWAAVKLLRSFHEMTFDDLLTREQLQTLPLRRRVCQAWRRWIMIPLVHRLMTRHDRVRKMDLIGELTRVREHMTSAHAPPPGCDRLTAEAVYLAMRRSEKRKMRELKRDHRGVRCAGGCGTRYGKRRRDHSISGGAGIESGWLCPASPCIQDPSAPHYCGMCWWEKRFSAIKDGPDAAHDGLSELDADS